MNTPNAIYYHIFSYSLESPHDFEPLNICTRPPLPIYLRLYFATAGLSMSQPWACKRAEATTKNIFVRQHDWQHRRTDTAMYVIYEGVMCFFNTCHGFTLSHYISICGHVTKAGQWIHSRTCQTITTPPSFVQDKSYKAFNLFVVIFPYLFSYLLERWIPQTLFTIIFFLICSKVHTTSSR